MRQGENDCNAIVLQDLLIHGGRYFPAQFTHAVTHALLNPVRESSHHADPLGARRKDKLSTTSAEYLLEDRIGNIVGVQKLAHALFVEFGSDDCCSRPCGMDHG